MRLRATRLSATGGHFRRTSIASWLKHAASLIRTAGRQSVIPALPIMDGKGHWWLDRNRTQPLDPAVDLEKPIEWIDDLTGNPVGWELGPERCVNGGADTDTVWTKNAGASISNGLFEMGTPSGGIPFSQYAASTAEVGKTYRVCFDVVRIDEVSGGVNVRFGNANLPAAITTTGRHAYYMVATGTFGVDIVRRGAAAFRGAIDNISVREVIRDESWLGAEMLSSVGAWTVVSGTGASGSNNSVVFSSASDNARVRPAITLNTARSYQVLVTVTGRSAGSLRVFIGATLVATISADGIYPFMLQATASNLDAVSVGVSTLSASITVRELPGNHLVSPSTGTGPRATARVNLLQRTEDLSHAAWTKVFVAVANGPTPPAPYLASSTLTADGSANQHRVAGGTSSAVGAKKLAVACKAGSHSLVQLFWDGNTSYANFDLASGLLGTVNATTATITPAGDGWYVLTADMPATSMGNFYISIIDSASAGRNPSAAISGSVHVTGADCRLSIHTTAAYPAYQRVGDGSVGVFDYDHVGFPVWRRNDGTRAMMTLGTVDMSGTSQAALMSVATKLSDAATAFVAEFSTDVTNVPGSIGLRAPDLVLFEGYRAMARGSAFGWLGVGGMAVFPAPHIAALSANVALAAPSIGLQVSATQYSGTPSFGTGSFGNHRLNDMGRDVGGTPLLRLVGFSTPPALLDMSVIDLPTAQAMLREYAASVGHTY